MSVGSGGQLLSGVAAIAAGLAAALALRPRVRPVRSTPPAVDDRSLAAPGRLAVAAAAGAVGWLWLPLPWGLGAGALLAVAAWVVLARHEPASVRRSREFAARQLPAFVTLFAAALRAGSAPEPALRLVCAALPGPAADRLSPVLARLRVGVDAPVVWRGLSDDPVLGALGRCLARAHDSGAPVADAVGALAHDLAASRRAGAEDRARAVGVKAALPLGLCLLPSFVLIGIAPVVAGLMGDLLGR